MTWRSIHTLKAQDSADVHDVANQRWSCGAGQSLHGTPGSTDQPGMNRMNDVETLAALKHL